MRADIVAAIPSLRAFAVSLCGNPDRADDLVHDTLLKALGSMDSFTEGTNLTAWLVHDPAQRLLQRLPQAAARDRGPRRRASPRSSKPRPPSPAHMDLLDFRDALQKLPADQREALDADRRVGSLL